MSKSFSGATMMPVRKVLKKLNTHVISLLMFNDNRNSIKFKVLSSIVYCIMYNLICVDYLCCTKTKLCIVSKGQLFENRTYNSVSGIGIPEILMNIISCRGFLNNTQSDVILSCRSKSVDYYLQKKMFFSKTIQMPLRICLYVLNK